MKSWWTTPNLAKAYVERFVEAVFARASALNGICLKVGSSSLGGNFGFVLIGVSLWIALIFREDRNDPRSNTN